MELDARHEGHTHTANLKYGVIVFGLSVAYALLFAACHLIFVRRWASQGKPPPSLYSKLVSHRALPLHTATWFLIVMGLLFHKFSIFTLSTTIKRAGRLGFCLVPLDIVLAIRPSLLATSYLDYIALHKCISRLLLFATSLHSLGYFAKWYLEQAVWQKSLRLYNFYGVLAFFASVLLLLVSMRPLRNRFYRAFYVVHNAVVLLFVSIIYWHARPGVGEYIFVAISLLGLQIFNRVMKSKKTIASSVITSENASLSLIRLSVPATYPIQWTPGSHTRLSSTAAHISTWFLPSHPFTIYSLPGDKTIDLVVKKDTKFRVLENSHYLVTFPFNSLPVPFFETTDSVMIICGGSGISLGVPLFRYFNSCSTPTANLCWATPNVNDLFVLDDIQSSVMIDVYVTKSSSGSSSEIEETGLLATAESIELDDLDGPRAEKETTSTNYNLHTGRPDINRIIEPFMANESTSKALVVCGPDSMVQEAKKWGTTNNIFVYSEFYSF